MKTLIEQMWSGELDPSSHRGKRWEEIDDLIKAMKKYCDYLEDRLGEKGKENVEKLMDAYWEMVSLLNEDAFSKGVSLGVRLVSEAYFNT